MITVLDTKTIRGRWRFMRQIGATRLPWRYWLPYVLFAGILKMRKPS